MNPKVKRILRHTFYGIAFLCLIAAFVFLSEKYSANSKEEVKTITDVTPIPHNGCRPPKRRRG